MTPDIRPPPITSSPVATGPAPRPVDPAALALQLLRPIDAQLLPAGESARAEVLRNTPNAGQFEVLLRLAQAAGAPPREISATSPQPLLAGTQVVIQAVSQTQLMAILQPSANSPTASAPLTRLDPAQFPPGSSLQARVLSQQPLAAQGEPQRFAVLARIIQGIGTGATLTLTSQRPVEPGSLLNATVGSQGELRTTSIPEQQRQLDLFQGLRDSMQRQASAEPLMSMLDKLANGSNPQIPATLQPAIRQVLLHLASVNQLSTEAGVTQAIRQSGLFLENNLAMLANALKSSQSALADGSTSSRGDPLAPAAGQQSPSQPNPGGVPPLSKLLPLLASLPTPPGVEPLPGADLKATLLNLLVSLQQQAPHLSLRAMGFPPPPWQQQMTVKPGLFPLPSRVLQALGEAPDLGSLLRLTAALLSRIQHHQFQSLGQSQGFADGSSQTVWQLEIPLREGQQFNHVQVRIQRDDPAPDGKQAEQTPQWEVRLAFNLGLLGPLQAIARLYKGRVSSQFWAEQPVMLRLLDTELSQLRDRLLAKGLEVGELSYHQGVPPQPRQAVQQRWIDEVT